MHGWPLLVHYCEACTYNTPVSYSASVWTEEHSCSHCGRNSAGADIAGESMGSMNVTQHDELAALFAQRMHLTQVAPFEQAQHDPPVVVENVAPLSEKQEHPIHFVSSHYTGTAHLRPDAISEPSASPPPSYHEALMPEAMAETLRQHSIEPSALLPNQVQLFTNADYEQRLRLLELWRIAPPSYPLELHLQHGWVPTTVEQEEAEARVRYEHNLQTRVHPPEEHMLDTTCTSEPMSPIREPGEDAWPPAARMRAASIVANGSRPRSTMDAEPYVIDGYRTAQHGQSTDPVYAAAAGLWQAPSYAHAVQQQRHEAAMMEEQYGMFEQIRNHADWEAMNERIAREKLAGLHQEQQFRSTMDEDMVL